MVLGERQSSSVSASHPLRPLLCVKAREKGTAFVTGAFGPIPQKVPEFWGGASCWELTSANWFGPFEAAGAVSEDNCSQL